MTANRKPYTLTPDEIKETVLIDYVTPARYSMDKDSHDWLEVSKGDSYQPYSYRQLRSANDPLANWTSKERANIPAEIITEAENLLEKVLRKKESRTRAARKTIQYKTIAAEARSLGLPIHYKDDLIKHDAYSLAYYNAPDLFLWAIRDCGTWLFIPTYDNKRFREAIAKESDKSQRYYLYKNGLLNQITPEQWANFIPAGTPTQVLY
jgi:hypothetical protein